MEDVRNEVVKAIEEDRGYDYISNNYYKFTKEEMLLAINAEMLALGTLYSEDYFDITMYDRVEEFPNADYVAVGVVAKTEDDFYDDNYGYIVPKSYMKNGDYIVEYKIIYRTEI